MGCAFNGGFRTKDAPKLSGRGRNFVAETKRIDGEKQIRRTRLLVFFLRFLTDGRDGTLKNLYTTESPGIAQNRAM